MIASFQIQITSLGETVSSHKKCLGSHNSPTMIISPCVLIWFSVHDGSWEFRSRTNTKPKGTNALWLMGGYHFIGGWGGKGQSPSFMWFWIADCSTLNDGEALCVLTEDFIILDLTLIQCHRLHLGSPDFRNKRKISEVQLQQSYSLGG